MNLLLISTAKMEIKRFGSQKWELQPEIATSYKRFSTTHAL
jgi:hypothetical protein